jgi:hypothetical protein
LQSDALPTIVRSPFDFTHALIVVVETFVTAVVAYATPAAPPITATTIVATRAERRAIPILISILPSIFECSSPLARVKPVVDRLASRASRVSSPNIALPGLKNRSTVALCVPG